MLARLTLRDFRNHEDALIVPRARFVLLTGENGAGKTNLLEAVSFLSPGRGLRRATFEEVRREGADDGFAVNATLEGSLGTCRIGTGTAGHVKRVFEAATTKPSAASRRISARSSVSMRPKFPVPPRL